MSASQSGKPLRPSDWQPALPVDRLLTRDKPGDEAVPLDVLFVGGGPAGLSGAIELARLVQGDSELGEVEIGVLEKAESLGEHCLSGAVVNPSAMRELFPDLRDADFPFQAPVKEDRVFFLTEKGKLRLPTPPTMRNHGNWVASICEIVRWLGEKAEKLGVNLFTGFPAEALYVEDARVTGVRTAPVGLDREGNPGSGYSPPTDLTAKVTVLSEGTRGPLTQAWLDWQGVGSENPQIFALGVKELWELKRPLNTVIHTMGWPLPRDTFGGSWLYPMGEGYASLGLVAGLDYRQHSLDVHVLLQKLKMHPLVREYLEGGEIQEWGAKTIPEGGYYSLPSRLHGDGALVVGDAAGFVDVPSLKGIHYAMYSGIYAARTIYKALKAGDTSKATLSDYDGLIRGSTIHKDLRETRNMRLAFKSGFYLGGAKAWVMSLTKGDVPGSMIAVEPDAAEERTVTAEEPFNPDGKTTFTKLDAVYRSGNITRDDIPVHLVAQDDVPPEVADFYSHMCPAGVYEREGDKLVINAPNCIDCKATDILGPRWTVKEGGTGPKYKRM